MALCIWFSRLDQFPGKPVGWVWPRAVALIRAAAPSAPVVFATMQGNLTNPCALGIASLTSQQITDLNADSAVWARELPQGWRTLTVADLPAALLTKLSNALTNQGLSPGIVGTDTLPQAFQKILDAMPGVSMPLLSDWAQHFHDAALQAEPF